MSTEQIIANKGAPLPKNFNYFGRQISALFKHDPSVQVAFVDFGGWDTHINEGSGQGQLANHLTPLGAGIADLITGLGPLYKNTQIVVMSEFGRTAKENGNGSAIMDTAMLCGFSVRRCQAEKFTVAGVG